MTPSVAGMASGKGSLVVWPAAAEAASTTAAAPHMR